MQIILKMTTACNLNCVYCSEGDSSVQTLPPDIFYKLVNELPTLLNYVKTNEVEFLFHGGEPMLYGRDNLQTLINYAKNNLRDYDVRFLMQTNGTLIDGDWIEFFKAKNISVGISIDGYPEIHDKNRRTKNNEPTAEKILQNLKLMRDCDMRVGTLMVFNEVDNVDADKLYDFLNEYDLQPKIHSVIACGRAANRADTADVYENYIEVMKRLFERALSEDTPRIIQPLDEMLDSILGICAMRECSYNGSCGKSFISVYPDGEVGFCGRDNFARLLTYGNLRDKNLLELYNSANAARIRSRQNYLKNNDCKNCVDWELCYGGCAFEAVNFFGTLESKYPNCIARKNFIKWLRAEGLKLLKSALIREKTKRRKIIKDKRQILNEIDSWKIGEVSGSARA